jgi:hypothetical protein
MTADQLIRELFVNHWFAITMFAPPLTLLYAWVTDQTAWWICSLLLSLTYGGIAKA